ncbi:cellulase-domain-containing protein [Sistotremastrum niveocremeum HHB9708]|uniref:cellulase n=2 Tax=Sistotremastraceae TaxID=3402574 RepID=A0A164MZK9_9AGAM|nr:cellulase-domain-containing protein [Sistotremastrum niveocremeum HHB9708]KZT36379.1 cellulase-domain-containing protein [Sistotremastrum suecicum HHB10207 ss-3]
MFKALASLLLVVVAVNAQSPVWGQCGGIGWSGSTTCASGSVCTYSNPYYSQCLPGTSTSSSTRSTTTTTSTRSTTTTTSTTTSSTTKSTTTTSSTTTSSSPSSTGYTGAFLPGVNLAGFDFGANTDGSYTVPKGLSPPPISQVQHFTSQGVKLFRIPFAWQLAQPQLGATISSTFWNEYDQIVNAALQAGAYVIVDVHNYARWNGAIIGESGGPTNAQFANLWSQFAAHYASQSKIIFGVMNEPHDLTSVTDWATSVQAAVNAIRGAGATSQLILIPGSSWASAQALPTEAGPALLKVKDTDGTVGKIIFDVHKYLDSDNSGTHADCVTDNTAVFQTLVNWLQQNGNRQAILSETGGGNTSSCETDLNSELAFIKAHSSTTIGYAVWSAGSFATSYVLSVTPNSDGSDQPLWVQAVKPNL